VVKLLLNTPGIDINARDSEKMTALMYAARCGALDVSFEPFDMCQ
jgi:ankyrin repeat protein